MDVRSFEDYERMRISGIERLLTLAHDPYKMSTSDVVFDHFERILKTERKRAAVNNIELFIGLGIHPCGIPKDYQRVLNKLPKIINEYGIKVIGEIGLNNDTDMEKKVFEEQLKIAKELEIPVVVHTPAKNKLDVMLKEIEIIDKVDLEETQVVIDHATYEIVEKIKDRKFYIGLSIQPGYKLDFVTALKIVQDFKLYDRFMINSDAGSAKSEILALPKFAVLLKSEGFEREIIKKITYENACKFLKLI